MFTLFKKLFSRRKNEDQEDSSDDVPLKRVFFDKTYSKKQLSGHPDIEIFGGAITLRHNQDPVFHREFTTDKCRFRDAEFSIDIQKVPLSYQEIHRQIKSLGYEVVNVVNRYSDILSFGDEYEKTHGYFCIKVEGRLVFFENVRTGDGAEEAEKPYEVIKFSTMNLREFTNEDWNTLKNNLKEIREHAKKYHFYVPIDLKEYSPLPQHMTNVEFYPLWVNKDNRLVFISKPALCKGRSFGDWNHTSDIWNFIKWFFGEEFYMLPYEEMEKLKKIERTPTNTVSYWIPAPANEYEPCAYWVSFGNGDIKYFGNTYEVWDRGVKIAIDFKLPE